MRRLFDNIDLRVRSLAEAKPFYSRFLPAIGFPEFCETPIGIAYDAKREHRKPEFIGLIEDPDHRANGTRIAFWTESKEELDRLAPVIVAAGAKNVEGPMFCPEYSPTYYGMFFEDPCGNRLEVCCRVVESNGA
jgi:predicted enzyme related to lactoylglutathione lyase